MSVTPRGNSWQASVTGGEPKKRWRRSFRTKAAADSWKEDAAQRLERGELPVMEDGDPAIVAGNKMTLEELRKATHQRYWVGTKSESWHRSRGEKVVSVLGATALVMSIRAQEVDRLVDVLRKEGKANGTINRHLAALSKMLKTAVRYIPDYPRPVIEKLPEAEARSKFYSPDEVDQMAQQADRIGRPVMVDLVYVGVDSGLRLSELLGLYPLDLIRGQDLKGKELLNVQEIVEIKPDQPWLRVRETKTNEGRTVPLPSGGRAHRILKTRIASDPDGPIFPVTVDMVEHYWQRIRELLGKADDPDWVFHTLRHTYCTRLAANQAGVKTIMRLAGHKSVATSMRYIKVTPAGLVDAVERAAMG